MSDAAAVSLILACLWVPAFYFGVRHRDVPTIAVAMWAWIAQAIIASGHVTEGRIASIPWVLALAALLIDRLNQDPHHILRVAAQQVEESRRMAHDEIAEKAAEFARQMAAERKRVRALEARLSHDI